MDDSCLSNSDDIYDDLDALFSPKASASVGGFDDNSSVKSDATTMPDDVWMDDQDALTLPENRDQELKKAEMNLYIELLVSDMDKRTDKLRLIPEYKELQEKASRMQELIAEKDSKLIALTQIETNLKKNICSLFKTAKAEIDQKDLLLKEANSRLDSVLRQRNLSINQIERLSSGNTTQKQDNNFKPGANGEKSGRREIFIEPHAEFSDRNRIYPSETQNNFYQSSYKQRHFYSPSKRNRNFRFNSNPNLDKRENCLSKSATTHSPTNVYLERKRKCLSNSFSNIPSATNVILNKKQNCDANSSNHNLSATITSDKQLSDSNIACDNQSVINALDKRQNCDANSSNHNQSATIVSDNQLSDPNIACDNQSVTNALDKRQNCDSNSSHSTQSATKVLDIKSNCNNTLNTQIDINASDKKQSCKSNSALSTQSISDSLEKKQNSESNSACNIDLATNVLNEKHSCDSNDACNTESDASVLDKRQNCDSNSVHNTQLVVKDHGPNVLAHCSQTQELLPSDSTKTCDILFNLLPEALRESLLAYERSQVVALNKFKQSLVNCYFKQCENGNMNNLDLTQMSTGEEKMCNTEVANSTFIYQQKTHPIHENHGDLIVSDQCSDLISQTKNTLSEEKEGNTLHIVEGSERKAETNTVVKSVKEDILKLYKCRK